MKVEGFDTETFKGRAYLLSSSTNHLWCEQRGIARFLKFLVDNAKTVNFFYNLDFDARAVLKHLSERDLRKLFYTHSLRVGSYHIKYIPNKLFQVNHKLFFDLAHFYDYRSLDTASFEFLKRNKSASFDFENMSMSAIRNVRDRLIKYCIHDSDLAKCLGEYFIDMIHKTTGVRPLRYYSIAYLTKKIVLSKIPVSTLTWDIIEYLKPFYFGGRVECFKKGLFRNGYVYDIRSCYPSEIVGLPNLQGAVYRFEKSVRGDVSFIIADVKMKTGKYVYPLALKSGGINIYPCVNGIVHLTGDEYRAYYEYFSSVKILKSLNIYLHRLGYPFENIVKKLYIERSKSDLHSYVYKKLLNSLYGCFAESKTILRPLSNYDESVEARYNRRSIYQFRMKRLLRLCRDRECYCCNDSKECYRYACYKRSMRRAGYIRRSDRKHYVYSADCACTGYEIPGRYQNLVYACLITSRARIKLFNALIAVGKGVIACYTDSLHTTIPLSSSILGGGLGEWELKGKFKRLWQFGNGIYRVEFDNGKMIQKVRGVDYHTKDLRKLYQGAGTKIKISQRIAVSQGMIESQGRFTLKDLNEFHIDVKEWNVNIDRKRSYPIIRNARLLLRRSYDSAPLLYSIPRKKTKDSY